MTDYELSRFEVDDPHHGPVPCAALAPRNAGALPICLFLYGGGGSRETLAEVQPLFESWWASGAIPPLRVATPDVGPFSFYLDDPERGMHWERFVAERFVPHLRSRFQHDGRLAAAGISMGGYGALKLAFARPADYVAVAALSPMIEPAFAPAPVPLRNRYHYPPEVPAALLGPARDPALVEHDHPIRRAQRNAAALRRSELAIYLDAASRDALHAHDGAEHLHRVLWQLDVVHEYRLRRDADHVGPDLIDRIGEAFSWIGVRLKPAAAPPPSAAEALRAQLAPLREAAAARDRSFERCYGLLPPADLTQDRDAT